MIRDRNEDTICAISTPIGQGGISVIRISGPLAVQFSSNLIPKLKKASLESHKAYFSKLYDSQNNVIDEVLATYFENGRSFTGEEVVEISCHGSQFISQKILNLLMAEGCRLADRGEFTFRAFMNNKLDLVQAESVLSLIESQSEQSSRLALRQLEGHVSKIFSQIENELTWCLAHIEASIDFSTEGLDVVDHDTLVAKLKSLRVQLNKVVEGYSSGRLVKDGIKIVLFGEPNVGKSSLFNLLVQEDKAIVTEVAGTTRDIIEAQTQMGGVVYRVSDTAGLRDTSDQVELIGVQRTQVEANKADILVVVLSADQKDWGQTIQLSKNIEALSRLFVMNKVDLLKPSEIPEKKKILQGLLSPKDQENVILSSHLDSEARERVLQEARRLTSGAEFLNEAVISSARQFEGARYGLEMLDKSILDLEDNLGSEFVAMNLKEGLISIQKILGHVYDDQILDRVFKEFCLGK